MTPEKVIYYYESGFWNIQQVRMAVRKGIITKEQFQKITGESY